MSPSQTATERRSISNDFGRFNENLSGGLAEQDSTISSSALAGSLAARIPYLAYSGACDSGYAVAFEVPVGGATILVFNVERFERF